MPHLVTLIRNLKTAVQQNDMLLNRIDMIADKAQAVIDERDDLHGWNEDYRNQIQKNYGAHGRIDVRCCTQGHP